MNENGAHSVPITEFCRFAGVCRPHFYRIMRGESPLTQNINLRLTHAIEAIIDGLRWTPVRSGNKPGLNNKWIMVNPGKYQKLARYERQNRPAAP
ncbi:MAG TPA: hypothetical protein VN325_23305 [Steroidobacteraceae bacterium]|nr:hypothetical protein [Steroidobacteraceae bacterium]